MCYYDNDNEIITKSEMLLLAISVKIKIISDGETVAATNSCAIFKAEQYFYFK